MMKTSDCDLKFWILKEWTYLGLLLGNVFKVDYSIELLKIIYSMDYPYNGKISH